MAVEYWASAGFQELRIQCRVYPEDAKAEEAVHVTDPTRRLVLQLQSDKCGVAAGRTEMAREAGDLAWV